MIIAYGSDLHLEFGDTGVLDLVKQTDTDVFILAGDIATADDYVKMTNENSPKGIVLREMLEYANENFRATLIVMGNHEHYGEEFHRTPEKIREAIEYLPNVHLLDNETFELDDVVFFGSTMWTDMGEGDPIVRNKIQMAMNDFRRIRFIKHGSYAKFNAMDAATQHNISVMKLRDELEKAGSKRFVSIHHHAPFEESVPYYYKGNNVNRAYYSETFEKNVLNGWFPRLPDAIVHGHIHDTEPYTRYGIDVYANARGYEGHEDIRRFKFDLFTI